MDGGSFRSLGNEYGLSPAQTYARVIQELNQLPDNIWISFKYSTRWSGILNVDGKYIAVKGYEKKIPLIWSVDFLTHDFPVNVFASSENTQSFLKFFRLLKTINYPLQVVVCDDVSALKQAVLHYFPRVKFQLCHTHYIENIRQLLHIRTDKHNQRYQYFFNSLIQQVFVEPKNRKEREDGLIHVLENNTNGDEVLQSIIVDVAKRYDELFCYESIPHCPRTNNIIECFNSHLQGRLKTIKGFQSFHSAERWLNGYILRRRTKPFTDCEGMFSKYNGRMPLELSLKRSGEWPAIPGIQAPKTER